MANKSSLSNSGFGAGGVGDPFWHRWPGGHNKQYKRNFPVTLTAHVAQDAQGLRMRRSVVSRQELGSHILRTVLSSSSQASAGCWRHVKPPRWRPPGTHLCLDEGVNYQLQGERPHRGEPGVPVQEGVRKSLLWDLGSCQVIEGRVCRNQFPCRCCWSAVQLCLTLCNPMDCGTRLPCCSLLEFAQTHVHWADDTIWPSHPPLSPSPPTLNLSQHQVCSGLGITVRQRHF